MLLDLQNNWIHWLRMDMDGLDVSSGRTVVSYFCPAVGPITFMLLLYRQDIAYDGNLCTIAGNKRTSTKPIKDFCSDQCRCILGDDPSALTDLYDMTLVGVTWFNLAEELSTNFHLMLRYDGLTLPWDSGAACASQLTNGTCPVPSTVDPLCDFAKLDLEECKECVDELIDSGAMGHSLHLGWYMVILCATILTAIFGHIM
ncbi:uncharacterized protein LOC117118539 [Anneissia japonica]|uniref:uncharacterized protein LOC117118539 n=1 Tax=Anneissia japonica TaxID=1529436 RepID=UPI00142581C6|nr:uncharacterized protein LOC117118539 [Anneissia japonica]